MNLERTKPETLAAGVMDLTPSQSLAAHEYAERLNAALARLGLTERLTLPPAPNTAIDELPGVVDVPLRKTLSVLMGKAQQGDASALATLEMTAQVMESIFAGLHARASVYPLALPSDESLATLPQGVDALLPRKISNGAWSLLADGTPSDGIQDGTSLVRLLCGDYDKVNIIKDDNHGWSFTKAMPNQFTNATEYHFNCSSVASGNITLFSKADADVHLDELETSNNDGTYYAMFIVKRLYLNAYKKGIFRIGGHASYTNSTTQYIYVGCKGGRKDTIRLNNYCYGGGCSLKMVELREGARQPFTLDCPSFQVADPYVNMTADNIVDGILQPLADNRYEDDGVTEAPPITINIGSANLAKLTDKQIAIATSKNYTLV